MTTQTRKDEIQAIQKEFHWFYPIIVAILILIIAILIFSIPFTGDDNGFSYITNIFTEMISIAVTFFIVDRYIRYRDDEKLKIHLAQSVKSEVNDIARHASELLRVRGWLTGTDGILQGLNIAGANLEKAKLWKANLQETNLFAANLQDAILNGAILERANLQKAKLQGVNLTSARLQDARLEKADLTGADLSFAKLKGAKFDQATLPDGIKWEDNPSLERFINRQHPEYYQAKEKVNKIRKDKGLEPIAMG